MRGKTNNPHGRPKGIPNKKNADLREKISLLIDDNWSTVQRDIESLEPRDRLQFLEKLIGYTLPKLQSIQVEKEQQHEQEKTFIIFTEGMKKVPDYQSMSDEELRALIAYGKGVASDDLYLKT